jgi:exodeoxyribonuclease V alpha subunit
VPAADKQAAPNKPRLTVAVDPELLAMLKQKKQDHK